MSKLLALIAGAGAGYMKQENLKRDQKREDERDRREQEVHNARMADIDRANADRDALRAAGSPVAVTEEQLAGPVDPENASPAAAAPLPTVAKAGGAAFASRGVADEAAAKLNTPDGTRSRVMQALTAQGNPVGADQVRTSGIQAEAAQMQLTAGQRAEAAALFDAGLREAISRGPEALATFMSESHADGNGGAVKFTAKLNPDGTFQMTRKREDGTETPFGGKFGTDEGGMATAGLMLSRAIPDSAKAAHMLQVREAQRRADHDAAQLKIAQQNANTQEGYRKDQAENMRKQRELEEQKIELLRAKADKPGGPIVLGLKDMRDFESDLTGHIKEQYPVKEGADEKERAAINAQATARKALGNTLFRNNAQIGIPLTAGTVLQAMELAGDRKNVRIVRIGGVAHEAVVVNGSPVITSGPLQEKQAAGPAPARDEEIRKAPPGSFVRNGAAGQAAQGVAGQAAPALSPEKEAVMAPLNAQVQQASEQMKAVAASGDQAAIQRYAAVLEQARAARLKEAIHQFGQNGANDYLSTLPL